MKSANHFYTKIKISEFDFQGPPKNKNKKKTKKTTKF